MKCDRCGADNKSIARFCAGCGASLGMGSILDQIKPEIDKTRRQFQEHLAATRASIDSQMAQLRSPFEAKGKANAAPPPGARSLIHPMEIFQMLMPTLEQITQSKIMAFTSPFIQANEQYRSRVENINFYFNMVDSTLNAYATDYEVELEEGEKLDPPAIVFLGGLAFAMRLMSLSLALSICPAKENQRSSSDVLVKTFRALGSTLVQSEGKFEPDTMQNIFKLIIAPEISEDKERFLSLARSLSTSMEMAVIAHEAGHLSLGHTLGVALNFDVSRNQEREADSFASSVLSANPFREYLFLGQVITMLLFAWNDHVGRRKDPSTHPLGRERFYNALTTNSAAAQDAADQFGLTPEILVGLLPPEDAQAVMMRFR